MSIFNIFTKTTVVTKAQELRLLERRLDQVINAISKVNPDLCRYLADYFAECRLNQYRDGTRLDAVMEELDNCGICLNDIGVIYSEIDALLIRSKTLRRKVGVQLSFDRALLDGVKHNQVLVPLVSIFVFPTEIRAEGLAKAVRSISNLPMILKKQNWVTVVSVDLNEANKMQGVQIPLIDNHITFSAIVNANE